MPKQQVAVELYYDGAWHDIVTDDDVFADAPIVIQRGQGDESAAPRPCQISMRLANDDDLYRTSNPQSPLYGKAGRNVPIRVSVGGDEARSIRGVAEVASWQADQTPDFRVSPPRGKAWVDIEAGGLLQRIGQWSQPLRSPLYRAVALSGTTPAEHWPMEDVAGSSSAVSTVGGIAMTPVTAVRYTLPGGSPLTPGGAPRFADGAGIPGSSPLPSFQGGGTLRAAVRTTTFDGYAVDWVMQFQAGTDDGGTTSADVLKWTESGTYVSFTVNVTSTSVTVFHATAADAAILASTGSATASMTPYDGTAHHFRYQVRQNGGSYLATFYVDGSLLATADNFVPGMTGTVGRPRVIEWNPGEQIGDFMPIAAGHLIIWASGQLGAQPAVYNALNGYAGELAGTRFARLLTEEGLPLYVTGSGVSSPMGPQRPDTLPNLVREIVTTEDGLLFDYRSEARPYLICRAARYNQAPTLELTPDDLPTLPREVTDDLAVHNVVTASQRQGGSYTARDDSGPLGTQAPPDGIGEYQQKIDVNVYVEETDLPQVATWWLRRGTVDLPRFPQLTIDLGAKPGLIPATELVDIGSVITIKGFRENEIRLFVLGSTEVIGTHTRTITFTCAPDQQFVVGVYDDTERRYDLRTCVMDGAVAPAATSLTFEITDDEAWSTTSTPYDLMISGERVTVTSMGARSGSGPYAQTATVRRSVNGIYKTLPDGAEVHIATPGRWAL